MAAVRPGEVAAQDAEGAPVCACRNRAERARAAVHRVDLPGERGRWVPAIWRGLPRQSVLRCSRVRAALHGDPLVRLPRGRLRGASVGPLGPVTRRLVQGDSHPVRKVQLGSLPPSSPERRFVGRPARWLDPKLGHPAGFFTLARLDHSTTLQSNRRTVNGLAYHHEPTYIRANRRTTWIKTTRREGSKRGRSRARM